MTNGLRNALLFCDLVRCLVNCVCITFWPELLVGYECSRIVFLTVSGGILHPRISDSTTDSETLALCTNANSSTQSKSTTGSGEPLIASAPFSIFSKPKQKAACAHGYLLGCLDGGGELLIYKHWQHDLL